VNTIVIGNRCIGAGQPTYIIAEMSANHNQDYDQAVKIIHTAKACGADAVKLQTYTPDTMTIQSDKDIFQINSGTIWDGQTLYDLYKTAYTPWYWQPKLKDIADKIGIDLFSSPFDSTAVDFLEKMDVPAYKVASLELVDLPLIDLIARTGKPLIMSTGMASLSEIDEAMQTARKAGAGQIALLKCVSAYPAPAEEMNLRTISHLAATFNVTAGLSDHTLGITVPTAAVTLGASIIEKHFTLSREIKGPDTAFSLEPMEFEAMVQAVRTAEKALGCVKYGVQQEESKCLDYRRSLFVVQDIKKGAPFTADNVRSIRPAHGLHTRHYQKIIGRCSRHDIVAGTPLAWSLIA
jgi:pseudaminic acid synthase